jgi:hypothetical protein
VNAHERRDFRPQLTFEENDKLFAACARAITRNLELSHFGRQTRLCDTLDRKFP